MCRLCSGEHHFLAIGRIAYTSSCSCCETRGSVWVSHLSPYLHPVMSMTSTETTSAVCDPSLGDDHDLANYIYILVATQGDGTPFSPDPFKEEDLMELCKGFCQATWMVCSGFWRPKHFSCSILLLKWWLPCISWVQPWHVLMNLSDSIPTLPLTPISELMWLRGVHTPVAPKPQPQVGQWFPSHP